MTIDYPVSESPVSVFPISEFIDAVALVGVAHENKKTDRRKKPDAAYRHGALKAISVLRSNGVDVATKLVVELKLAEKIANTSGRREDWERREKIASLLFKIILYPAVRGWAWRLIQGLGIYLPREDIEDLIQDAMLKICKVVYDPSHMPFLVWCFTMARYSTIDGFRKETRRGKNQQVDYDWDLAEETVPAEPKPQLSDYIKAILLRAAKHPNDKRVLEVVFAGIDWNDTDGIHTETGLSPDQVTKSKARIKKTVKDLGLDKLLGL